MEMVQLPRLMQLHGGGRKVYRNRAPADLVEKAMPAILVNIEKLKRAITVGKERLAAMPQETDRDKKIFALHKEKHETMKSDLAEFERIANVPAPAPVPAPKKAKK